jgi:hypothetical protein
MAIFDFPANPAANDIYTTVDGIQYVWSGYAWYALTVYQVPVPPLADPQSAASEN